MGAAVVSEGPSWVRFLATIRGQEKASTRGNGFQMPKGYIFEKKYMNLILYFMKVSGQIDIIMNETIFNNVSL